MDLRLSRGRLTRTMSGMAPRNHNRKQVQDRLGRATRDAPTLLHYRGFGRPHRSVKPATRCIHLTQTQDLPEPAVAPPRRSQSFVLRLAISLLLTGYILSRADLVAVVDAFRNIEPGWIGAALILQLLGPAIIALRWSRLLAAKGVVPGWRYLYVSTLVSTFFRQFLPSTVGGDVIRGYDAWRAGAGRGVALMSLVLDRLFGLLALAILAGIGLLLSDQLTGRLPGLGLYVGLALVVLVAMVAQIVHPTRLSLRLGGAGLELAPRRARDTLSRIATALGSYRNAQGVLGLSLVLSLILQVVVVTFYWTLGRALGLDVDYASFFVIAPIAIFVMMLPVSINGIGVREGIFVFLLGQWGVGTAQALALAWMEYGIFLLFGLLGGAIHILRRRQHR
jgi:glycosyltransferase 2 family protein